jgi:hypothetical protein
MPFCKIGAAFFKIFGSASFGRQGRFCVSHPNFFSGGAMYVLRKYVNNGIGHRNLEKNSRDRPYGVECAPMSPVFGFLAQRQTERM